MSYNFDYIIDKVKAADFTTAPFKHIYIEDIFSEEHFKEIQQCYEIEAPKASNDRELINGLSDRGFKAIEFPGAITDHEKYIKWHQNGKPKNVHTACEGFGLVLRLYKLESPILKAVNEFISGEAFNKAIAEKYAIKYDDCFIDGGIQKYLDGYEISPHPDIRRKAATFMVNINPNDKSEGLNHHTHYMKFAPNREYVKAFWEGNKQIDRCWVPWDWTESVKQQTKNNSIVIFSPSNDTMHAVKADYNHLLSQRTQLYGNIWYTQETIDHKKEWEDIDLVAGRGNEEQTGLKDRLPKGLKSTLKTILGKGNQDIGDRNL